MDIQNEEFISIKITRRPIIYDIIITVIYDKKGMIPRKNSITYYHYYYYCLYDLYTVFTV